LYFFNDFQSNVSTATMNITPTRAAMEFCNKSLKIKIENKGKHLKQMWRNGFYRLI